MAAGAKLASPRKTNFSHYTRFFFFEKGDGEIFAKTFARAAFGVKTGSLEKTRCLTASRSADNVAVLRKERELARRGEMCCLEKRGKIFRLCARWFRGGTLLSKPASGRAAAERERDLRLGRRSARGLRFASLVVATKFGGRRIGCDRARRARTSPRSSRLAERFRVVREKPFAAVDSGAIRNIPLFQTALGSTIVRVPSRERPIRRADGPTAETPFSSLASSFEDVEKR